MPESLRENVKTTNLRSLEDPVTGSQSGAGISQSPTLSMAATQAGIILGTAAYMPPEQARGRQHSLTH